MSNIKRTYREDKQARFITSLPCETERGFTVLEGVIVVLLVGVVVAFAAPRVSNAMREHRLSSAVRDITDLIQKAKTQAMADNRNSSLVIDTAGRRMGLIVYDDAGVAVRTDYVPLPDGVDFDKPPGNKAPMSGAPIAKPVSFPKQANSPTVFQQNFNSRGFPAVTTPGDVNALYLGDGEDYRAITMTSVGGLRVWYWEDGDWIAARR